MSGKHAIALLWALVMAYGLWLSATGVAVHSELADLLPDGTTATQRLLLTQVRTGLAGRLILLCKNCNWRVGRGWFLQPCSEVQEIIRNRTQQQE